MIHFAASITLFSFSFSGFCQDTIVSYIDGAFKPAAKEQAIMYRMKVKVAPDIYVVSDYQLNNDEIVMKTTYSDEALTVKHGEYFRYFDKGRKAEESVYMTNKLQGKSVRYYENGQIADDESYQLRKRDGTCRYYYENGNLSAVETCETGTVLTYKLYKEDGSPDDKASGFNDQAQFPGGKGAMYRFLSENLVYPTSAVEADLQGTCYIRFLVEEDGTLSDIKVSKGIPGCPECNEEALRVITMMPDWEPGLSHNRIVKSFYALPIVFKLNTSEEKKNR